MGNDANMIMKLTGICKGLYDFSGRTINNKVNVLNEVNFDIKKGDVHVLLGENGAGKSTLVQVLCGVIPADKGFIEWKGEKVTFGSAQDAHKKGIGLVSQEFSLCPNLSVAQNIWLGREPQKKYFNTIDKKRMRTDSLKYMKKISLKLDVDTKVKDLSVAQQQMVEIVKALSMNPEVLILDEPTSALADDQVGYLFDVVRTLIAGGGVNYLYLSQIG